MNYRCPYCKHDLGPSPQSHCPSCGKIMRVPVRQAPDKRRAKIRALNRIEREYAQKMADLQTVLPPTLFRNPRFYIGVIVVLAVIGGSLFTATDTAVGKLEISPPVRALRHLDVLAEALGRYRFHVGHYPDREQGLAALVRDPQVPKWDGPYINLLRNDPWDTPFVYEPGTNALPALYSCGQDKAPGTRDDLYPDPARFEPGTAWTNGWVSADKRLPGVTVLPSRPAGNAK
jgi:general secretion pathway protein G